jgi:methylphosphotriester-DNA--protein-cysteine methyltransferase
MKNTLLNHSPDMAELAAQARWSAKTLAHACNVSSRTLRRYMVKRMGMTLRAWLMGERARRGRELLAGGASAKAAAAELGYSDSSHFRRALTRASRATPVPERRPRREAAKVS